MKKLKRNIFIIAVLAVCCLLLGCSDTDKEKKVDYSQYSFTDTSWTRHAAHDVETIRFGSDGSFVYYCSCGNPVNDSDLNEGYTYDDQTKTVTISYIETTDETVSEIKIEMCDEENLKLSFDGEIRSFVKEKK